MWFVKDIKAAKEPLKVGTVKLREFAIPAGFEQLTVILVGTSGTMTSIFPPSQARKINVAREIVDALCRAAQAISPPAVYGLAMFPSPVTLDFGLEPVRMLAETRLKGHGSVCQALIDISAASARE
jgi:hypothetical protein